MCSSEDDNLEAVREKYIQDLRSGQLYSIGKFDDQVLFISSGALVLSLNFIKDIVALDNAVYLWCLYTSWWVLGFTIIISVTSHLVSYHLTEKQIKRVENKTELTEDKLSIWLNYAMAICLILGIGFQIYFVTINTKTMADKNQNLNEIQGNTQSTPKENIFEKALPVASAPKTLQPKQGVGQHGLPVQSAPKAVAQPKNTSDSTSTGTKK